jgi:hypothetical protein
MDEDMPGWTLNDEDEEPSASRDETEDPICEKLPSCRERTRSVEENLFRALLGLCQDADDGRFPSIHTDRLIKKTRESTHRDVLKLAKEWITILERERRRRNWGALCWTSFLEAYPRVMSGDETVLSEMEEWVAQVRRWST